MLIIGAKGFAKEVLEVFHQLNQTENLAFYDDVNTDIDDYMYNKYPILKTDDQAKSFFKKNGNDFTIGIGNPALRFKLYNKFINLGGKFSSSISPLATIGNYDVQIGKGCNVLSGSIFSNSTKIGIGCIVYYGVIITHDCIIEDFVELSPGVTLLGAVTIRSYSQIGSNSTILPNITIGKNSIIGAGSVVTKDIPDNCVAVGTPAKVIKQN